MIARISGIHEDNMDWVGFGVVPRGKTPSSLRRPSKKRGSVSTGSWPCPSRNSAFKVLWRSLLRGHKLIMVEISFAEGFMDRGSMVTWQEKGPLMLECLCFYVCLFVFFLTFWLHPTACGILVPWPGIKPTPSTLEGRVLTTGLPGKSPVCLC